MRKRVGSEVSKAWADIQFDRKLENLSKMQRKLIPYSDNREVDCAQSVYPVTRLTCIPSRHIDRA